jgi:uncharacterized protein (TIGR00290 family)
LRAGFVVSSYFVDRHQASRGSAVSKRVVVAWSGGKDSALALHRLQQSSAWEVEVLLTTVTEDYDRVSMHGVSRALLEAQAESLGLALLQVNIPADCPNEVYDERMRLALAECRARGIEDVAFGDIFLQDVRRYREERLAQVAMQAVFPLWGTDSGHLARDFVRLGFKAITTCVDLRVLDASFAGREFDERFLADLPPGVDPCGENGEFHSFVYDGPNLRFPLLVEVGERVERAGFLFADLRPKDRLATTEGEAQVGQGL